MPKLLTCVRSSKSVAKNGDNSTGYPGALNVYPRVFYHVLYHLYRQYPYDNFADDANRDKKSPKMLLKIQNLPVNN